MTTFEQLGLSKEIIKALKENGFESPFPIQQAAIPLILKGLDIIGQAHTGTGKTAAFSLPMLKKVNPRVLFSHSYLFLQGSWRYK
jgi:ATP-dependent RNA helicase DeaD